MKAETPEILSGLFVDHGDGRNPFGFKIERLDSTRQVEQTPFPTIDHPKQFFLKSVR